jgi:hypothetical protein
MVCLSSDISSARTAPQLKHKVTSLLHCAQNMNSSSALLSNVLYFGVGRNILWAHPAASCFVLLGPWK